MKLDSSSSKYITSTSRATIYEDGHVAISQEGREVFTPGYRKSKILQNVFLPRWVENAIKQGKAVRVQDITAQNDGDHGWYVIIRGEVVTTSEEVVTREETYMEYSHGYKIAKKKRSRFDLYKKFGDEREFLRHLPEREEVLYGLREPEFEEWLRSNPKPEDQVEKSSQLLGCSERYWFDSRDLEYLTVAEIETYQPHEVGVRYSLEYRDTGSEILPVWEERIVNFPWSRREVTKTVTKKRVISLEETRRMPRERHDRYESNDGYGFRTEIIRWTEIFYIVVCEDGTVYGDVPFETDRH